jgi:hypothetical protein
MALETVRATYGSLIVSVDDPAAFASYEPIVRNIANVVALRIETDRSAEALLDASHALEQRVRERTAQLEDANRRLMEQVEAREMAAAQLSAEKERLVVTLRSIGDAVITTDVEGRITLLNAVAETLTGWRAHEALGRPVGEVFRIIDEGSRAEVENPVARVLREGVVCAVASRAALVAADGRERPIADSGAPIRDANGTVAGVVLVFRDVTDARKAEDDLRERLAFKQKFEQAQKLETVGRLAGGVAHDFNNLLTVILTCTEQARSDLARKMSVDAEDIEQILAAAERARDLTRQLLAFARKQVVAPTDLDLNTVVRGTEKLLRRVLGEDIALVVRLEPDLGGVHCDPGQIEQIIMNLAVNSRDAMEQGGAVFIETANVKPQDPRAEPSALPDVRLTVRDTGIGMSREVQQHLFEPFFTTKPPGRGTGLGLATVYGIVQQSGGRISVDSEVGRGTAVHVTWPSVSTTLSSSVRSARPAAAHGSETIVVVEDDPSVRRVTARALSRAGYRVLAASDGAEALESALRASSPVDLVISDVVMPGMSGPNVVDAMRKLFSKVKVLYVSGYTRDSMATRGVVDEGAEFVQKPFTADALLARVRSVLDAP